MQRHLHAGVVRRVRLQVSAKQLSRSLGSARGGVASGQRGDHAGGAGVQLERFLVALARLIPGLRLPVR